MMTSHEPQEAEVQAQNESGTRSDKHAFAAAVGLVCLTVLLLMCLVAGRWMGADYGSNWQETSIWGTCDCGETAAVLTCGQRSSKEKATQAFSIIGAIFEFAAVVAMLWFPKGKVYRIPIAICFFAAGVCFILTIAIFGSLYHKSMCGGKLRDNWHLDWAYGIRVVEFVAVVTLGAFILLRNRGRKTVFAGIVCLYLCVFTTTSRGWASWKHGSALGYSPTEEYGLWEHCTCQRAGDVNCGIQRNLLRASQAFEILGTIVALLLSGAVVYAVKLPRVFLIIAAWVLVLFVMLPWIFMAAVFDHNYCGYRYKDIPGYKLRWAFGLQVSLSALMIGDAILISLMPAFDKISVK